MIVLKVINLFMNFVPYKLIFHISGLSRNKISDIYTNLIVLIYWKNINSLSLGGNTNIVKIEESKFIKRKKNKRHYVGCLCILGCI